jgi:hypothetical protein
MRCHVSEIRLPLLIPANSISVILNPQKMNALLLPARQSDVSGTRINAILDKLRDRLERITLRKRNDPNRIPIIANPQFAGALRPFLGQLTHPGDNNELRPE